MNRGLLLAFALLVAGCAPSPAATPAVTPPPPSATSVPTQGHAALDAHDGELVQFGPVVYEYGTSYRCGFEWPVLPHRGGKPWCGFVVLASRDLVHWSRSRPLLDTAAMQDRCLPYGCYNPRVMYDATTGLYVLWFSQVVHGPYHHAYGVATSPSPLGPFSLVSGGECCATLNHPVSDGEPFVDVDGTGWLATDDHDFASRTSQTVLRRLNAADTQEVLGEVVIQHPDQEEAQELFWWGGSLYLVIGTDCGYCRQGSTLRYYTAPTMVGPWRDRGTLGNDCGGQPTAVSAIGGGGDVVLVLQSDGWLGLANEAAADQRWEPLTFWPGGGLRPPNCALESFRLAA